jgi:hypothetical protein
MWAVKRCEEAGESSKSDECRGGPRKLQFPYEDEPVSVIYGNNCSPTHIHVKGKSNPVTGREGP